MLPCRVSRFEITRALFLCLHQRCGFDNGGGSYHTPIRRLKTSIKREEQTKTCLDGKPHIDSKFYLHIHGRGRLMTNTTMINYSTRDFATKEQLDFTYCARKAFTPEVIKLFTDAMLRGLSPIWNRTFVSRWIVFRIPGPRCLYCLPAPTGTALPPSRRGLTTKVVGSRGVIVTNLCQTLSRTRRHD